MSRDRRVGADIAMTKLVPDERCAACGSILVPPSFAPTFSVPLGTDYLCLKCGRPYRWVGSPPRLTVCVVVPSVNRDDEDTGDPD